MALKVGSLYVSLSANTSGLIKGFADAAKATEKLAKEVKKTANDVAGAALGFTAIGAAAMKMAASVDGSAKKSMDGLEKSLQLVAVQVADIIKPAVDSLSKAFKSLAGYIAGIDPETKKSIGTFATWTAGIAVAAKVIATISGLVSGLAGAFSGIAGVIAAIGSGPLLAIVATLAAVAVGIVALHYAWRTNLGGMADATRKFVNWLGDAFNSAFEGVITLVDGVVRSLMTKGMLIYKSIALYYDLVGDKAKAMQYGFAAKSIEIDLMNAQSGQLGRAAFVQGLELGEMAGNAFAEEFNRTIKDALGALGLDKLFNVKAATPRAPVAAPEALPTVGSVDTSSLATMKFVSELQTQAAIASEATDKIATEFSKAVGEAASAEQYQKDIAAHAAAAAAHAAKMRAQLKATVGIVLQNSGALGSTIQNITQGAQSGGVWGAIIAAVMEVFQRMASWKKLMDIFEKGLKRLGEFLEPLLSGIFDLVGTFTELGTEILAPIFKAFKPLFDIITGAVRKLEPIFNNLGMVFDALGPLIEAAIRFGEQFPVLELVAKLLNDVFKAVSIALLTLMWGANNLLASFGDANAQKEAERIQESLRKLWLGIDTHGAVPAAELGDVLDNTSGSLNDLSTAADKVAESLSNVPAGYKVALARYNADWGASPGWSGGAPPPPSTSVVINGDIITDANSIGALADDAVAEAKRRAGQLHGNPLAGGKP